jgi:LmbE family N-acetylglucosaminyl deacetylase
MITNKIALSIMAHPDDCELMCAGTMALLHQQGWEIHIATMTPGDCGSATHSREEISKIRKQEATNAARILSGQYHCLECDDVFILYDKLTLLKVIGLIRIVKPALIFAPSPSDYMIDHEITSKLVQTACFAAGIPNIISNPDEPPFDEIPALYYADAMEGKDKFGKKIEPSFVINISTVIDTKEKMLASHESQRCWLLSHHGIDEYLLSMKRFAKDRGILGKCPFAEGFRQHLGHAYPQANLLKEILPNETIVLNQ